VLIAVMCGVCVSPVLAQSPTQQPPPQHAANPEAEQLARGWALLAEGKAAEAGRLASQLLLQFPTSTAALVLLVDAEVARGGALVGLDAYEGWLGSRRIEEARVVRRVARLLLQDVSRTTETPLVTARLAALAALAEDGDAEAAERLAAGMLAGRVGELRMLAEHGDERAVNMAIAQLAEPYGNKSALLESLGKSGSRTPIPALRTMLTDKNDINRSGAADALGKLGATEAIEDLRALLADPVFHVRLKAAGALQRLHDGGGFSLLQEVAASEHAAVRMAAAREVGSLEDPWWQTLVRGLASDPDPVVRLDAARLLAPYDSGLARAVIDRLLADGNIAVREAASLVLAEQVAGDFATLRGLLRTSDALIRVHAATRILELTR